MNIWDVLTCELTKDQLRTIRTFAWRATNVSFMIFALDLMSPVGLRGFARAAEMDSRMASMSINLDRVTKIVANQAVQLARATIVDAQTKRCEAPKADSARIYQKIINDAQESYWELTRREYSVPSCADL